MAASPERGQVWQANLGGGLICPAVIVQAQAGEVIGTTIIVPLSPDLEKAGSATNVRLEAAATQLDRDYVALCPQLRVLPVKRLERHEGTVSPEKMNEIGERIAFLLGLPR